MVKSKYYAVRVGKIPGIYMTWSQAEEQIKGFSGAVFKSFSCLDDAERFMEATLEDCFVESLETKESNQLIRDEIEGLESDQLIAFVDGSFSSDADGKAKYGFGVVLITKESEIYLYRAYVGTENLDSRNVAGEIEGVRQSILWAIENGINKIKIYYDYLGIEKWVTGEWKSNKKITKEYSQFIKEKSKILKIEFQHIKAHSGVIYNEKADELAKRSLLSHGYKTYNDGSVYFIGFSLQTWRGIIKELSDENKEFDKESVISVEQNKVKEYLERLEIRYNNDRVTINCYNGNKSYVQGKRSVLFQKIISYAIEKLPDENSVIEVLNTFHALTIEESEVETNLKELIPNFRSNSSDTKHYNNLLSAVFNTMLTGYMPDYTCLITPVFRATEYYLHRILNDKLEKTTEKENGLNNFSYFSKDEMTGRYYYNSKPNGLNHDQISLLDDIYNYYNRIRHPYSHWSNNSMDVQVITEMYVARDIIYEGLNYIDTYYIMF